MTATQPYHHGSLHDALLDAAEAILTAEGSAALTLRAAARRAGVSHAAPTHHFGDLAGLLSDLAARGFERFADQLAAAAAQAAGERAIDAVGRAYVAFARDNEAMFLLMFRSDRLDPDRPALHAAQERAFRVLATEGDPSSTVESAKLGLAHVALATHRWALVHGFAMLLIDDRLHPLLSRVPGTTPDALLDAVIATR